MAIAVNTKRSEEMGTITQSSNNCQVKERENEYLFKLDNICEVGEDKGGLLL